MPYSTTLENASARKPISLPRLLEMHARAEKIAVLTCYDASFAALLDQCGIEVMLVGDSLGMVLQGHATTLPVTVEEMAYHVRSVARGNRTAWIVADLPFGSYHESPAQALANAVVLMRAGAHMVKIEGGLWVADTIRFICERGIPVCAHIGLTPQSVHALGGYRVQGKTDASSTRLKAEARAVEEAGAQMIVFEMMPAPLAGEITHAARIPTIGIGAGVDCSGQVLVLHDMLGIFPGKPARFVRNFMQDAGTIENALRAYVSAVKDGSFPAVEHTY